MDSRPVEEPPEEIDGRLVRSAPTVHRWTLTEPEVELGKIRAWIWSSLVAHEYDSVADAVLVLDSVVTGAFSVECGPSEIRLVVLSANAQLLIEIDAHGDPPTAGSQLFTEEFSTLLLEELTVDWGIRRRDELQTIWATVDLSA